MVNRDPLLVVEGGRRSGLIDEGGCAPGQVAAGVEGALVYGDGAGRRRAVEAQAGVEHVALAVEGDAGIATRVVDAAGQTLDSRDECAQMRRIAGRAAPGSAAIVGEIGAGVGVAQRATWRSGDRARPGARDVVVGRGDHAIVVIGINCDRGFVLRCGGCVLIHQNVRRRDAGAVKRTAEHDVWRDWSGGDLGDGHPALLCFFLDES